MKTWNSYLNSVLILGTLFSLLYIQSYFYASDVPNIAETFGHGFFDIWFALFLGSCLLKAFLLLEDNKTKIKNLKEDDISFKKIFLSASAKKIIFTSFFIFLAFFIPKSIQDYKFKKEALKMYTEAIKFEKNGEFEKAYKKFISLCGEGNGIDIYLPSPYNENACHGISRNYKLMESTKIF